MSNIILYIAMSIDGFIARPDGNLDWLHNVPPPQQGDYGYAALLSRTGTIIMGRKTYEEIIGFGIDWPYNNIPTYVVTQQPTLPIVSPDTQLITHNFQAILQQLKEQSEKDIWLVGGGQLVATCIREKLLDEMIITIIPKIIGNGISLFPNNESIEQDWTLVHTQPFHTGVVNLTYKPA